MKLTKRDTETLNFLLEAGDVVTLTNKQIGALLGLQIGSVNPRLNRLEKLGYIHRDYTIDPLNGHVYSRRIHVCEYPEFNQEPALVEDIHVEGEAV